MKKHSVSYLKPDTKMAVYIQYQDGCIIFFSVSLLIFLAYLCLA